MDGLLDSQLAAALGQASAASQPTELAARTPEQARRVAEEFESFFLSQMLGAMFQGVNEDNPFGGGPGEDAFKGMLHEEYAKVMAATGGLGLADRLTAEILQYQDIRNQGAQGDEA